MTDITSPSPVDSAAALIAIDASRLGQAQKTALRLVVAGRSYREAADAAGLRSTGSVRRHAQRFGLVEAHDKARSAVLAREQEVKTELVIGELRKVAKKATRELLRRLDEAPDKIQTRDLTVLAGVSIDKIRAWEGGWDGDETERSRSSQEVLSLLERLVSSGNTVEMKVTPTPDPAGPVSDVGSGPVSSREEGA